MMCQLLSSRTPQPPPGPGPYLQFDARFDALYTGFRADRINMLPLGHATTSQHIDYGDVYGIQQQYV